MNQIAERIARHLFDLTPPLVDNEEAMMFCRGAALKFVQQFQNEAQMLKRSKVVDFKSRAAGEREDESD